VAFAAIHNLAIQDTAIKIVNHPALVLALRGVLQSSEYDERGSTAAASNGGGGGGGDAKSSPRAHAAATLLVLERTITPEMDCYETLRELIDAVNPAVTADADEGGGRGGGADDDDGYDSAGGLDAVNATAV
jgi:hypothetical protein